MMKRAICYALGIVSLTLALAASGFDGQYENQNFQFDNNCSGTGGSNDAARCSSYVNAG